MQRESESVCEMAKDYIKMVTKKKYKHSCPFSIPLLGLVIEPFPTGVAPCFFNSKTLKCTYCYASANSENTAVSLKCKRVNNIRGVGVERSRK